MGFVPTSIITLTTDFGLGDPFAGIMKGVLLSVNPNVRIVDITHGVPAHDILAGAMAPQCSYSYFPKGTIHLAVVDPGVGSSRRPFWRSPTRMRLWAQTTGSWPAQLIRSRASEFFTSRNQTTLSSQLARHFTEGISLPQSCLALARKGTRVVRDDC